MTLFAGKTLVLISLSCFLGCGPKNANTSSAATSLSRYVTEAKQHAVQGNPGEGSLWSGQGRYSNLYRDFKAREINDVVTISIKETTAATSTADTKNSKATDAKAGMDNLFGLEKLIKEIPTSVAGKATSTFKGEGSTNRNTTLTASITARVIDVLPNGYLVVEGVRDIRLNNENQTITLTGVIRPEDISSTNVVSSSSVAQMEVRVQGRGSVSQPIKPGWLYRILNGVLPF